MIAEPRQEPYFQLYSLQSGDVLCEGNDAVELVQTHSRLYGPAVPYGLVQVDPETGEIAYDRTPGTIPD